MQYPYSLFEKILEIFWPQTNPSPESKKPLPDVGPPVVVAAAKPDLSSCREWRLTQYYLASETKRQDATVPILDNMGRQIDLASPSFFSSLSLEGSGVTGGGRLVNVSGKWVPVDPAKYQKVLDYHKKYLSHRDPSYSGLKLVNDHVARALAYYEVQKKDVGIGYGVCHSTPLSPYRTLAADIGTGKKSDQKFKSLGGVVPVGTKVYIHELDGKQLPDGTTHDGWCVVNDTGGGIFGAHFDVFVGKAENEKKVVVPSLGHIWFEGIEKLPKPYVYGLKDS